MDIIEKVFPTEESLQELRDNYEKELTFSASKLEQKQVDSVINYQKAVVSEEYKQRFVLLLALGFTGVEGMKKTITDYLNKSDVEIKIAQLDKLDDEVLDND